MGVNTPAEAVVVAGLEHPDSPYIVAEYKNIIGRAGRLGYAEHGTSYLIAPDSNQENYDWNRYIWACLRTCILALSPPTPTHAP